MTVATGATAIITDMIQPAGATGTEITTKTTTTSIITIIMTTTTMATIMTMITTMTTVMTMTMTTTTIMIIIIMAMITAIVTTVRSTFSDANLTGSGPEKTNRHLAFGSGLLRHATVRGLVFGSKQVGTQKMFSPKSWIGAVKREAYVIYLTAQDSRVPWHVKALAICVAVYALSPIDLIPDFIPVVGYADDWIVVTLGSLAVAQLLPPEVIAEHRAAAAMASEPNGSSQS